MFFYRNMFNQEIPGTEASWQKNGKEIKVFIPYLSLEILKLLKKAPFSDTQITVYLFSGPKREKIVPKIAKLSEIQLPLKRKPNE